MMARMGPEQQTWPLSVFSAAPGGAAGHQSGNKSFAESFKWENCMQTDGRMVRRHPRSRGYPENQVNLTQNTLQLDCNSESVVHPIRPKLDHSVSFGSSCRESGLF